MNNLPPLEDLHLLCTVARNRSFIVTAKELGVSPAYVSKRIALLEKVLQVRLLHRTTRQVSLNEEGDTVFRWAQLILEDAQQMTEAHRYHEDDAPRAAANKHQRRFWAEMHRACAVRTGPALPFPAHPVRLFTRPVDLVAEGFDLDLAVGGEPQSHLIVKRIKANARVLCAAPAYWRSAACPPESMTWKTTTALSSGRVTRVSGSGSWMGPGALRRPGVRALVVQQR